MRLIRKMCAGTISPRITWCFWPVCRSELTWGPISLLRSSFQDFPDGSAHKTGHADTQQASMDTMSSASAHQTLVLSLLPAQTPQNINYKFN